MQRTPYEFWFVTGSQHLYGSEALAEVSSHSRQITQALNEADSISFPIVVKPVVKTPEEILQLCMEANSDENCAGLITWMHTFSPGKMWIGGLSQLHKPLLHFHTQFHREIPWDRIDMDFMNLHQSAHGDREFGFIATRLGILRKEVVGHWRDEAVQKRLSDWMRTAIACLEGKKLKVARFGDNMRRVAVTEGDKVEAQIQFGWSINGYGVGDLVQRITDISDTAVHQLFREYQERYDFPPEAREAGPIRDSILEQARIELGLKLFLREGGYSAFTTTFEDLHGLKQLPGLAVQRLMSEGYGFGAEGDWRTAGLLRMMKIMADNEGTSFMEDYTYHLEPGNEMILGAHMLEVCPTIAAQRPGIRVHPLSIGGKADPARLVFDGRPGPALNVSLIDLGNRFRLLINKVDAVHPKSAMPHLPVARVLWKPRPSLHDSAEAWMYAGGAHHTVFSYHVTTEQLLDWAEWVDMEALVIDEQTSLSSFRRQLKWNDAYYQIR